MINKKMDDFIDAASRALLCSGIGWIIVCASFPFFFALGAKDAWPLISAATITLLSCPLLTVIFLLANRQADLHAHQTSYTKNLSRKVDKLRLLAVTQVLCIVAMLVLVPFVSIHYIFSIAAAILGASTLAATALRTNTKCPKCEEVLGRLFLGLNQSTWCCNCCKIKWIEPAP